MNRYIDIYCERIDPNFWAEPANALTNLSFIIAAFFTYRLAQETGALSWREYALAGLIALIGLGSFLFHTFATGWAQLADVLPILLFQVTFLIVYASRVMKLSLPRIGALLGVFFILVIMFEQLPRAWLNGSLGYAPALIFLIGLGVWHLIKQKKEKFVLLLAGATFILSLAFRSIDMAICPAFPLGVHFLWHVLNGLVLYLTARAYILNAK